MVNQYPWIKKYLSASDLDTLEKAVKRAENTTTGEIVPIVVQRSSTIGHVPLALFLMLSLVLFILEIDREQVALFQIPHSVVLIIDALLVFVLVRFLAPLPFIERLFTPKGDQQSQVEARALQEFYELQVNNTKDSTGILLFVSLMEHQAVVLGDKTINEKLKSSDWEQVIDSLIQGVKKKSLVTGFESAIEESGRLLTQHFPSSGENPDELKNHLIIKN